MSEQLSSGEQPEFFEIKLQISSAVNDRLSNMAERRSIELTELLRRALGTFDVFDRLQLLHPEGHAEYVWPTQDSATGIAETRFELNIPIK